MAAVAASVGRYCRFFQKQHAYNVLDYGAGKLRNALFLADAGFRVYAADLPEQLHNISGWESTARLAGLLETGALEQSRLNVDLVISNYVFNIIPDGVEKERYLSNTVRNLRPAGYLLVEVRCRREDEPCGSGCSHHLQCPGCVKTYSHEELDRLITPHGFRRISHYYRHHALAVIYQLRSD